MEGAVPLVLTGVPKLNPVEPEEEGTGVPNANGEFARSPPAGGVAGGAPKANGLAFFAESAPGVTGPAGAPKENGVLPLDPPNKGFGAARSLPPVAELLLEAFAIGGAPNVKGDCRPESLVVFCAG